MYCPDILWNICSQTYARGLRIVSQNQLLPPSGTAIDRTRPTLARLMQVQKVSSAACPLLGIIMPSNLLNSALISFIDQPHSMVSKEHKCHKTSDKEKEFRIVGFQARRIMWVIRHHHDSSMPNYQLNL